MKLPEVYITTEDRVLFRHEAVSWVNHPFHGIHTHPNYHTHIKIEKSKPHLYDTDEKGHFVNYYSPAAGWAKIDHGSKTIHVGDYTGVGYTKTIGDHLKKHQPRIKSYGVVSAKKAVQKERDQNFDDNRDQILKGY